MKGIHPNLRRAATLAAIVGLLSAAGCRTQQGGAMNPFLAPDRVPPPATRAILPGQAQPYYPGDPLPVMQSTTQPVDPRNSSGGLAWSAPGGEAETASQVNAPASRALAFSNEPTVAVPSDEGDLRFAMPAAPVPEVAAVATPQSRQQPVQLASVPAAQAVVPASYTEPVIGAAAPPAGTALAIGGEPIVSGPWRSPQVAAASAPVAFGVPPMFGVVAPALPQASTMDVRLRAVPSPLPEPVESNAPRIRLPGYAEPQPWTGAGVLLQPGMGNVVQTVAIAPLPPPPYDPMLNLAAAPPAMASRDGFRPRSSMR